MAREMKDCGLPWIGLIPKNWEVRKVKNYYKLETGFTPDTKKQEYYTDDDNGFDWITISDLNNSRFIPSSTKSKITQKYLDDFNPNKVLKGSLLYSFKLSVGQVAFTDRDIYTNEAIASFGKSDKINLNYLFYSSSLIIENANENIYGAKLLNQDLINNAYVTFPPLQEQKKIADFLDKKCQQIDSVLEKTRESIEEYKKLKNAVITQAITKGIRPNRKMKDSGIEWIGEVPEDWNCFYLFQIFNPIKNKNINSQEKNLLSLSYGKIVRKNIETTFGLLPESFDSYNIIQKDDIVLRLTDLQNDHKSLRVGLAKETGIITSAYLSLRMKSKGYANYYYYLLHNFDILKGFYGMGAGVRQGLNWSEVRELRIAAPVDKEEQIEIAEYLDNKCSQIDNLISKKEQLVSELETYKKSLIYEYVTGKKEV